MTDRPDLTDVQWEKLHLLNSRYFRDRGMWTSNRNRGHSIAYTTAKVLERHGLAKIRSDRFADAFGYRVIITEAGKDALGNWYLPSAALGADDD